MGIALADTTNKDTETLNIDKEKVIDAYKQGSEQQKKVLEKVFGVDILRSNIVMDRIKTFEDALAVLGPSHPLVKEYNYLRWAEISEHIMAYLKLSIVTEALNDGWFPKFVEGEERYFPYFGLYTDRDISQMPLQEKSYIVSPSSCVTNAVCGMAYEDSDYVSSCASACAGPRLAFKTRELAEYAGRQFATLYAEYLLNTK